MAAKIINIVICPGCGSEVPEDNRGCPDCGYENNEDGRPLSIAEILEHARATPRVELCV